MTGLTPQARAAQSVRRGVSCSDTPDTWGHRSGTCGQRVDPQARQELASILRTAPLRAVAHCTLTSRQNGGGSPKSGHPSILHNLWTKVWSRRGQSSRAQAGSAGSSREGERDGAWTHTDTGSQHQQWTTTGSAQPPVQLEVLWPGIVDNLPPNQRVWLDRQQAADAGREHRRGRRSQRVHPQPARGPPAHADRGHPQRAARQAGPPRGQRRPDPRGRPSRATTAEAPGPATSPPSRGPTRPPRRPPVGPLGAIPRPAPHRRPTPRAHIDTVVMATCRQSRPAPR